MRFRSGSKLKRERERENHKHRRQLGVVIVGPVRDTDRRASSPHLLWLFAPPYFFFFYIRPVIGSCTHPSHHRSWTMVSLVSLSTYPSCSTYLSLTPSSLVPTHHLNASLFCPFIPYSPSHKKTCPLGSLRFPSSPQHISSLTRGATRVCKYRCK